jgi:hypothetical protein
MYRARNYITGKLINIIMNHQFPPSNFTAFLVAFSPHSMTQNMPDEEKYPQCYYETKNFQREFESTELFQMQIDPNS